MAAGIAVVPGPGSDQAQEPQPRPVRVAVGFATTGRAGLLLRTMSLVAQQSCPPDAVFVSAPQASDVSGVAKAFPKCTILVGPRGLTRQRNSILDAAAPVADVVVFFDDDFLPQTDYLRSTAATFASRPEIVMTTGHVLRDGICGPGISFEEATANLEALANAALF